jgi:hypothetical protein
VTWELHHHDARRVSDIIAPESVDLIVTSPPYFALRSYRDLSRVVHPDGTVEEQRIHYPGQLGSEATPGEFVDNLIACTADWLTVLKPGGSLFVNLGDSYAGSGGYNNSAIGAGGRGPASYKKARYGNSKDGLPARWTMSAATWLAGVIDCDGCIGARYFKTTRSPSVVPQIRVGMMDPDVVIRCAEITGVGRVFKDKRDVWHWSVASQAAGYVLERIWPHLLIKQRQALAAIEICRHVRGCGARGRWNPITDEQAAYRRMMVDAIQAWNQRAEHPWSPPRLDPLPLPHGDINPKPKSRYGLPWRYAIRCIDELGLILRADIIWSKPNGLPESVTDRVRMSHEYVFHFTKQGRYFAAIDEVREEHAAKTLTHRGGGRSWGNEDNPDNCWADPKVREIDARGKVPGSVWTLPSEPLQVPAELGVDHFAAFPSELARRCILGWTPSGWCTACGEPRRAVVERSFHKIHTQNNGHSGKHLPGDKRAHQLIEDDPIHGATRTVGENLATITGYACACTPYTDHPGQRISAASRTGNRLAVDPGNAPRQTSGSLGDQPRVGPWREYHFDGWTPAPTTPAVVLDPFSGTSTTVLVADQLGRHGIGVDLSKDYLRLGEWRIKHDTRTHRKVRDRSGLRTPEPPAIGGQLDLFGEASA